jgi:hypothetical protein
MCYTWNMKKPRTLVLLLATMALTVAAAYGADDIKPTEVGGPCLGRTMSIETGPFRLRKPALFESWKHGGTGPFRWDPPGQRGYIGRGYDSLMFPWVRKSLLGSAAVWMQEYYQPPSLIGVSDVDSFLRGETSTLNGYDALPSPCINELIRRASPGEDACWPIYGSEPNYHEHDTFSFPAINKRPTFPFKDICDPETNF